MTLNLETMTSVSRHTPAVQIARDGERMTLRILDWCYGKLNSNPGSYDSMQKPRCPVAGPIDIDGAQIGDVLAITIEAVRPQPIGTVARIKGVGPIPPEKTSVWDARLNGQHIEVAGVSIKLQPMVGMVGVRPDSDEPLLTRWTGNYGGNLDTRQIAPGATVELPVFTPGAGLFIGDIHAAMGEGEMTATGVECAGEIDLSVKVIKNSRIDGPRIRAGEQWITLHTDPDFRQAAAHAAAAMQRWLRQDRALDENQAALIIGLAADLGISQMVNPAGITAKVILDWRRVALSAQPNE